MYNFSVDFNWHLNAREVSSAITLFGPLSDLNVRKGQVTKAESCSVALTSPESLSRCSAFAVIKMWVLSKPRITIFATIKMSRKGGNDPHSCPWNFNCDNYVSSGSSYANYPTAWCTILNDNLESFLWERFQRHLRNTRKHYCITAARLWSLSCARQIQLISSHPTPPRSIPLFHQRHGLPNGLFLQVYDSFVFIPLHAAFPATVSPISFSYKLTTEHYKVNLRSEIFGTHDISNAYMKQNAQLRQWHKS